MKNKSKGNDEDVTSMEHSLLLNASSAATGWRWTCYTYRKWYLCGMLQARRRFPKT